MITQAGTRVLFFAWNNNNNHAKAKHDKIWGYCTVGGDQSDTLYSFWGPRSVPGSDKNKQLAAKRYFPVQELDNTWYGPANGTRARVGVPTSQQWRMNSRSHFAQVEQQALSKLGRGYQKINFTYDSDANVYPELDAIYHNFTGHLEDQMVLIRLSSTAIGEKE